MTDEQVKLVETAFQMIQFGTTFSGYTVPSELGPILNAEYADIVNEASRSGLGWQSVAHRILRDAICRRGYFAMQA